ncbi:MAG: EAL domain-containing protein, partial [Vicinamibacterales bacterium]
EIVGTIIELAHRLKLDVIAEGVESEAQLLALRELRCERAQGYLFSRPVPVDNARSLLGAVLSVPVAVLLAESDAIAGGRERAGWRNQVC